MRNHLAMGKSGARKIGAIQPKSQDGYVGEAPTLGENSYPMTTRRNHYVPVHP
jgi:hypothetical protein